MFGFPDFAGQGRLQLEELTLALVLSSLVGIERELRHKSAGLRTHALVGVATALIMLVSKYGFMDILEPGRIVLDPSRVVAQVVSGIGFLGAGVIFMRRDAVRGLTTAASVWLTAALGMACGAGLVVLAVATTAGHFIIMLGFPGLIRWLRGLRRPAAEIRVRYHDRRELPRDILICSTKLRFCIDRVRLDWEDRSADALEQAADLADYEGVEVELPSRTVTLRMQVKGKRPVSHLIAALSGIQGVREVATVDEEWELD